MPSRIEPRHLTPRDAVAMHATFEAAFSDYALPAHRSFEELESLTVRRGIRYELSVGAFDGDVMVAVTAVGFGTFAGRPTAYDIFTGVRPGYRGRGLAGRMFDFALPALEELGAECFLLEVLQVNEPAIRAYERQGFRRTRELPCFRLDPADARLPEGPPRGLTIRPVDAIDWLAFEAARDWLPSWQNARASFERALDRDRPLALEAADDAGRRLGYAALYAEAADLAQLAVLPEFRRRGIGSALIAETRRRSAPGKPLRALNINARATADLAFFTALGAVEYTRQWEMTLELRPPRPESERPVGRP